MKRFLFLLVLVSLGYAGVRMYPEVRRYLRIKAM
jgi:uncharacterized protein DUF6893